MQLKRPIGEHWPAFITAMMVKFLDLNKMQIGEQKAAVLIKLFKGKPVDKIAEEEQMSSTRIRQLIDSAASRLEKTIGLANVEEFNSLNEICKGLEAENNALRRTLKIHGHKEATPISKLDLSLRAINILNTLNITSIEQLCITEVEEILKVKNAGIKTITEIENALSKFGLTLNAG